MIANDRQATPNSPMWTEWIEDNAESFSTYKWAKTGNRAEPPPCHCRTMIDTQSARRHFTGNRLKPVDLGTDGGICIEKGDCLKQSPCDQCPLFDCLKTADKN
jgi:hypothetical protein